MSDYDENKLIPFLTKGFLITYKGKLYNNAGIEISLETFNKETNLKVKDIRVLQGIAFQEFKLPPYYWEFLIISNLDELYPENYILTFKDPMMSLEYPGFFIIPYFSNYVVSESGILLKKSEGRIILGSKNTDGYFTYRMTSDSNKTGNYLRHRIKAFAFLGLVPNYEMLDINHINGIPGDDRIDNIEWATRTENNLHAVNTGLCSFNKKVEIYDLVNDRQLMFNSYSQAGKFVGVTETTISNRVKSNGNKSYNGYLFRPFNEQTAPWILKSNGDFKITKPNGDVFHCDATHAARLCNMTRTSLLRLLRSNRNTSNNGMRIERVKRSAA